MSQTIEPLALLSGVETLGTKREGWTLDLESGFTEDRAFRASVRFEHFFRAIPVVHLGIVGFDISNHDAARLKARVENISHRGFDIVLSTWLNTRAWQVDVSWMAIGR
ncbi:MAG: H-type lectin domain-containing protein [Steroidobacteraceae bacterium]